METRTVLNQNAFMSQMHLNKQKRVQVAKNTENFRAQRQDFKSHISDLSEILEM